jgi:hypothetical protein
MSDIKLIFISQEDIRVAQCQGVTSEFHQSP